MKTRLLLACVVVTFILSGCSPTGAAQDDSGTMASTNSTSATPVPTTTPDSAAVTTADPVPGSGATPGDGVGDALKRATVLWQDYPAGTQSDIDALTAAADCKSLDSQYGSAIANADAVRSSSGHGDEALLTYINEARTLASCSF